MNQVYTKLGLLERHRGDHEKNFDDLYQRLENMRMDRSILQARIDDYQEKREDLNGRFNRGTALTTEGFALLRQRMDILEDRLGGHIHG